jgi:hypothetical protein
LTSVDRSTPEGLLAVIQVCFSISVHSVLSSHGSIEEHPEFADYASAYLARARVMAEFGKPLIREVAKSLGINPVKSMHMDDWGIGDVWKIPLPKRKRKYQF